LKTGIKMTTVANKVRDEQIPNQYHKPMVLLGEKVFKRRAFQNHLLNALPDDEYDRLFPHMELVSMQCGDVLYESGGELRYAYFPTNSIATLLYIMENGATSEVAVIGNEGVVGIALLMGGDSMPNRAIIQSAGFAYRMKKQILLQELNGNGNLLRILLLYTQALITQMSQTAVCNRHHTLDQQLCRWLLLWLERLDTNEIRMTQDLIATMLGVRREGITEAAGKLQHAGIIKYRRGHITVLDRPGLEARACECYEVVKNEFERLLPFPGSQETSKFIYLKVPTMKRIKTAKHNA
jgi:CRP-like cAMP-binding protein